MFAETSSEVQVGAAYEPSCTISIPGSVTFNISNYYSRKDLHIKGEQGGFGIGGFPIYGTVNCAKDLIVQADIHFDNSNGQWSDPYQKNKFWYHTQLRIDRSGIFPITNTPDATDDGVYSVAMFPRAYTINAMEITHYSTGTGNESFNGAGNEQNLQFDVASSFENCPLDSNDIPNCPAGDITGSAVISLSW